MGVWCLRYGEAGSDRALSAEAVVSVAKRMSLKQLLKNEVPLAHALSFLLRLGSIGLGCPVELEFALKLRNRCTACLRR